MEQHTDLTTILSLIQQPAFCVRDGIIANCNSPAQVLFLPVGQPITDILGDSAYAYEHFSGGCLFLVLKNHGHYLPASVTRVEDADVFVIEAEHGGPELTTLSMAATALRQPLSTVIADAASLFPAIEQTGDTEICQLNTQMNHNLWKMHRMLCNMSDAIRYTDGYRGNLAYRNVTEIVTEIFQKTQELAIHCGITMNYSVHSENTHCLIDSQLLERAVYNMLSNAMKASGPDSSVSASLYCRDKRLFISVEDRGEGIPNEIIGNVFRRYQRRPGIVDGMQGLGLGMSIIRAAAQIHSGTVLLDRPMDIGTRITLSFPIRTQTSATMSSGSLLVDYSGGWSHSLLELSDVLPDHLYTTR